MFVLSVTSLTRFTLFLDGLETPNQTVRQQAIRNPAPLSLIVRYKEFKERVWQDIDWIILAMGRKRWQAVVNKVMNLPLS
jgi:hypothetical protein